MLCREKSYCSNCKITFECIPKLEYLEIIFSKITKKFLLEINKYYIDFIEAIGKVGKERYFVVIEEEKIFLERKGHDVKYCRNDFGIKVFFNKRKVYCFVKENIYSFDSMLRVIFSALLVKKGGVLVHSSGIINKNFGYLFIGKSGKGKSTIVKNVLSKKIKILSDELVGMVILNNSVYTFPSPFWGEMWREKEKICVEKRKKLFKVRKLFFLSEHCKNTEFVKVDNFFAMKSLLSNSLYFFESTKLTKKVLNNVSKICSYVKCYKLNFDKSFVVREKYL